jgi:hypothetical protein
VFDVRIITGQDLMMASAASISAKRITARVGSSSHPHIKGVNVPVESTTPSAPLTLQSFSPALVPGGGASSGRRSNDPSGSRAKIVTPVEST